MKNYTCHFRSFLLLIAVLLGSHAAGFAQVEVSHKSDWFYIEPGTDVFIKGSLISLAGNADPLSNLGGMYISDSVSCYGDNLIFGPTPDTITANVYLNGKTLQTFTGDENMRFGNLYIQNTYDSLGMENNVEVYNFIQLDSGNINTHSFSLDLLDRGRLIGENNDRRVYTEPYGNIHLNRPLLSGQTYSDLAGTGLGLKIDGNLGTSVDVYRGNMQQPNVSNGSIDRFFYFDPQFNGMVSHPFSEYFDANELQGNDESKLEFFLSESAGVTWTRFGGVVDTSLNQVAGDSSQSWVLTDASMLTLAEADCDSLPYLEFAEDTVAICGAGQAWLAPNGIVGFSSIWSSGAVNQDSIQVNTPGQYAVTITDLNGCPNSDTVTVVGAPVPVADFTVTPVCIGDTSFFNNQSTVASGTLSHFWDLDDVFTATVDTTSAEDPFLVYSTQGSYTVNLTVTSNRGCTATIAKTATVLPYPVVDFTVADLCEDSLLALANLTTVTPSAGLLYHWDFGNGDTAIVPVPSYGYTTNGPQSITLTATSNGCTSTLTKGLAVHPNPVASFSSSNACLGDSTVFTNTSTLAFGTMSHLWTLAPGSNSTLVDPTFQYPNAGPQNVTLEVSSNQGCVHDTTPTVSVNALPQPSFSAPPTCQGEVVQFNNTSSASSSFQWNFNGAGSASSYNAQFVFANAGNQNVVLTETDANGCVDSIVQVVVSKPAPLANFTTVGGCEGDSIAFLNTSSTASGNMLYNWDFGDATTSTLTSPGHAYAAPATYNVQLIAENNGCFDTLGQPVTIDPLPVVNLGGNITTCDSQYVFDAQNPGSSYLWSNASTQQTLTATFNGPYWVSVTNGFGCVAHDTVQLTLNNIVTPQLGNDSTFCNAALLDAGYPGATYLWSTGATTQTISATTSGLVWVEVTDQNNCVGRDSIQLTVVNAVVPTLGPDLSLCDGDLQVLDPMATGVSYLWSTGATTGTISVSQAGTYWVDLVDANGCIERDSVSVIYNPNPVVDLGPDGAYCDSLAFDLSQPNTTYSWSTGGTSAMETLLVSGTYSVQLTDVNSGCESSDTIVVTFSARPVVDLGQDTVLCSGSNLLLDAQNPGNTYAWNVGGTAPTLSAASSGMYAVTVTSAAGCTGEDSIEVVVQAPFDTNLGPDFTLCQGQVVQITSPVTGGTYVWALDGNVLSNTQQTLNVGAFGSYTVVVTDSVGCVVTDTIVALQTGSEINAEFLVSTATLFAGDTLQFVNLSYPGPFTSFWSFGDGAFSIAEDPQHPYFAAGTYTATLEVSNGICSDTLSKALTIIPKVIALPPEPDPVLINDFAHFTLYPNPTTGDFTVEVELLKAGDLFLTCMDMRGKILFTENKFGKDFKLSYEGLNVAQGMYLINLRVSERSETIKFIKR